MEKDDAKQQLHQYRRRISREMDRRESSSRGAAGENPLYTRISPIQEERSASPNIPLGPATIASIASGSVATTSSTESGNTIKGGATPGLLPLRTPSYPFPRMASSGPSIGPTQNHAASSALGKGENAAENPGALYDQVLASPETPASAATFLPVDATYTSQAHDIPSPNLYDLSLMLTSEPGLDAWWATVVQIMTEVYQAGRITLAVPADATDVENVPWGQRATYNGLQEDDLSVGYLARGSSFVPSSTAGQSDLMSPGDDSRPRLDIRRPSLLSRHSFTTFEEQQEKRQAASDRLVAGLRRPTAMPRSKSYLPQDQRMRPSGQPSPSHTELNEKALEEHDAEVAQNHSPSWRAPQSSVQERGRVLPVLQALGYEADPLIDHNGVTRVLERGKVIALTRSYPYLESNVSEKTPTHSRGKGKRRAGLRRPHREELGKLSNILGDPRSSVMAKGTAATSSSEMIKRKQDGVHETERRPKTPMYEEYEQAPPSPWSQSPAPSPAVRSDPAENPFFTDSVVDGDTFNPGETPEDYSNLIAPEAIGVDNSWTVLHIPLIYAPTTKPASPFKLDPTALAQSGLGRGKNSPFGPRTADIEEPLATSTQPGLREKILPVAILSLLTPLIPYPSNLRHSLEYLAPHLATSFSLARQYTNLEQELQGLQRRRPQQSGFGAVDADGRVLVDYPALSKISYDTPAEGLASHLSLAGSMTSPSDFSQPSRSTAASPGGTPSWEPASRSFTSDRRPVAASPVPINADSYFPADARATAGKHVRPSPAEKRSSLRLSTGSRSQISEQSPWSTGGVLDTTSPLEATAPDEDPTLDGPTVHKRSGSMESQDRPLPNKKVPKRPDEYRQMPREDERRNPPVTPSGTGDITYKQKHTHVHSQGADFASTFQSLPPSTTVAPRPMAEAHSSSRSGSVSQVDLPPPSDKLKGLMLDSLPAHVFVALPQTGDIVWVNSRYLTYRGQTAEDLANDPWSSLHPDDRPDYLKAWSQSVRTGEQFSRTVRIRRFDGVYRYFYARAIASRDKRGVIVQFLGSYMDIHDQRVAELKAARQEEIEASEAKHRLLANLIPQIIFTATEHEGITFANEQWLCYTGQSFEDSLGLGFIDFVHPDDLAKCRIPTLAPPTPAAIAGKNNLDVSSTGTEAKRTPNPHAVPSSALVAHVAQQLSHHNSSAGEEGSVKFDLATGDLAELAKHGVVKLATDNAGRLSYTTEVRLRDKGGEYRWHLVRCVETEKVDFGSGVSSYFGSATDIHDLKLLESKLTEAMDSKSRFLSNMSHEIRTPLIGISGMVSFLQETTLNDEQKDYTNTIQTSANSLLMIINDILDLSKVDAGMMKLNYEWFHTRSLIEDVNELVSAMAIAKKLELNYIVDEEVPAWVRGDKVRIRQVLLNVIGNAIKFTTTGEVFSRCRVVQPVGTAQLGDDEIMLEFSVIDTGRGFSKEEADLIFKRFSQIDGSSTRQHGGSGLGLVISRQLVELHGGKMEGTAVPGKGSTFTFTARFGRWNSSADRPEGQPIPTPVSEQISAAPLTTTSTQGKAALPPAAVAQILTGEPLRETPGSTISPMTGATVASSGRTSESGSSMPSVRSDQSQDTHRSSASSIYPQTRLANLSKFGEAARTNIQDLSDMKLEMPSDRSSEDTTPIAGQTDRSRESSSPTIPPLSRGYTLYSILVISPQTHSREATVAHIKMTLPKNIPHHITALATAAEAEDMITGDDAINFTHVVINLPSPEEVIHLAAQVLKSDRTRILILSDTVQRQAIVKLAASDAQLEHALSAQDSPDGTAAHDHRVTYIYKPVKPSRFAVIFDPAQERDISIDRNRSTAARIVETQKQNYAEMERRMGGKGYRVLLIEDNPVNQKVLKHYLKKVGVEVEIAGDGVVGTDMVFQREWGFYSLILCDLYMPRKDGYQACREIRDWEARTFQPRRMPIIALSANVMSDVYDKCLAAGFSDYVTKPVDFIKLSNVLLKVL